MSLVLLLVVGLGLIGPLPVDGGSITIANLVDTTLDFHTDLTGSVTFPTLLDPGIHILVDIPGTPWVSNSTIVEQFGLTADSLAVSWTIQHILGPHPEDVDPAGSHTLSGTFTAAAPGPFGFAFGLGLDMGNPIWFTVPSAVGGGPPLAGLIASHPTTMGAPHVDVFGLFLSGFVTADPLFGTLRITNYKFSYVAEHCYGVAPAPPIFVPGLECDQTGPAVVSPPVIPEPSTVVLLLSGLVGLWAWRSRSSRMQGHDDQRAQDAQHID